MFYFQTKKSPVQKPVVSDVEVVRESPQDNEGLSTFFSCRFCKIKKHDFDSHLTGDCSLADDLLFEIITCEQYFLAD